MNEYYSIKVSNETFYEGTDDDINFYSNKGYYFCNVMNEMLFLLTLIASNNSQNKFLKIPSTSNISLMTFKPLENTKLADYVYTFDTRSRLLKKPLLEINYEKIETDGHINIPKNIITSLVYDPKFLVTVVNDSDSLEWEKFIDVVRTGTVKSNYEQDLYEIYISMCEIVEDKEVFRKFITGGL